MFGVDEAGRGPVLGSMFIACVSVDSAEALPSDLRDSKRLSNDRIAHLAETLREMPEVRFALAEVPTERIDDPDETMTTVTVEAFADALTSASEPREDGFLDACHTNAETFGRLVADASSRDPSKLTSEHGADDVYPIVSAASILAKDAREQHVADLRTEFGEVGSGYPSDPTTREFLEAYVAESGGLPACTRRSWKTAEDVLTEAGQSGLEDF